MILTSPKFRFATLSLITTLTLAPLVARGCLVINEVHYDAEPKTEFVEFIELLNTGPGPIDLGGWSFADGVVLTFPAGTSLGVSEYLLVAENPATLPSMSR